VKEIALKARDGTLRAVALVDDKDYDRVVVHRWRLNSHGYALMGVDHPVTLHRFVLELGPEDPQVDHINRDRLDCRRGNLRLATTPQNCQNVTARGGTSRLRGVSWDRARGKWVARYGQRTLGRFDTEEAAGRTAAAFRRDHVLFSEEALA
jgi:hypothetical protein